MELLVGSSPAKGFHCMVHLKESRRLGVCLVIESKCHSADLYTVTSGFEILCTLFCIESAEDVAEIEKLVTDTCHPIVKDHQQIPLPPEIATI